MSFKDILVYLDSHPPTSARLDVAVQIAHTHRALLTGYYIIEPVQVPAYAMVGEALSISELQDEERDRANSHADRMRRTFFERTRLAFVSGEWHCVEGNSDRHRGRQAGFSDLMIVGQDEYPEIGLSAAGIVLNSGRPVLVVPTQGISGPVGQRILIGWNASRESIRALNDALPFLSQADEVHLAVIGPDDAVNQIPRAEVCFHLERHGINAEPKILNAATKDAGDTLLSYAADEGMDLIVMGAYGRSQLTELLLGGATRSILKDTVVPIFMSH